MRAITLDAVKAVPAPPAAGCCPRCHKPMVDPQGLGWCKACGYCRSLEDGPTIAPPAPAAGPTQLSATTDAVRELPGWFWIAGSGVVVIGVATFVGGHFLPLTPLGRALFTTVEMALGILVMFVGQFIALVRIAPEDSGLKFLDAIMPFRLYGLVMKRLPANRHTIYLGAWGLTAIIAANVFVGGLDHWLQYMPGRNKDKAVSVQTAK
jgi:hypothetical protein